MHASRSLKFAAAVALVCLLASAVQAQQGGRRGRGGFGGAGGGGAALLQNEKIQKELELVDDQVQKIKALGEQNRKDAETAFSGLRDLPREERGEKVRAKMQELQKAQQAKIDEILLPNQRDRLKEIAIQIQGTGALNDKEVQEKLGLTADQKDQLTKLSEARRASFRGGNAGGERPSREDATKAREEARAKTLAILTAEQKEKFEKMQGKKLEIDRADLFPQRGAGGRRGGNRPASTN